MVIGISDYIPYCLKFCADIKIRIEGEYTIIVNHLLWSEYFSKTLLKECQHHMMVQSYTSEGVVGNHPLFVKYLGKIYKLEECLEWNCQLRKEMVKSKAKKGEL